MDYSKMGGPKKASGAPKHGEHKRQQPKGKQAPKAELLARMKAAAEKKKAE
ncbi:hypothetical protein [Celeribacter persicus]|jgi:hypothetical protein|uniref:Uncharacterized protein n=1 Tax=Celeribacter persicus TaxID=1651082 RepID=A0A2T5HTA2_9RHOB|nr:hypothetical protein [Celeribacter persicus]PTQ74804.1 hypothetical protein C8N42_10395 [Celeribacter persicus]